MIKNQSTKVKMKEQLEKLNKIESELLKYQEVLTGCLLDRSFKNCSSTERKFHLNSFCEARLNM